MFAFETPPANPGVFSACAIQKTHPDGCLPQMAVRFPVAILENDHQESQNKI